MRTARETAVQAEVRSVGAHSRRRLGWTSKSVTLLTSNLEPTVTDQTWAASRAMRSCTKTAPRRRVREAGSKYTVLRRLVSSADARYSPPHISSWLPSVTRCWKSAV